LEDRDKELADLEGRIIDLQREVQLRVAEVDAGKADVARERNERRQETARLQREIDTLRAHASEAITTHSASAKAEIAKLTADVERLSADVTEKAAAVKALTVAGGEKDAEILRLTRELESVEVNRFCIEDVHSCVRFGASVAVCVRVRDSKPSRSCSCKARRLQRTAFHSYALYRKRCTRSVRSLKRVWPRWSKRKRKSTVMWLQSCGSK
jgi:hypothetical protein